MSDYSAYIFSLFTGKFNYTTALITKLSILYTIKRDKKIKVMITFLYSVNKRHS